MSQNVFERKSTYKLKPFIWGLCLSEFSVSSRHFTEDASTYINYCTYALCTSVNLSSSMNKKITLLHIQSLTYDAALRGGFFLFLANSGSCMRPAAKKQNKKKHTEHERVQF